MSLIEFILEGVPLVFSSNNGLKSLNDIDKQLVLDKLNENESIASNEFFQAILKKALDM